MNKKYAASMALQRPSGRAPDHLPPKFLVCPHCKHLVDELTGCPRHGAVTPIWSAVVNRGLGQDQELA